MFAARNAIDGVIYPSCHGRYPFESWGINRDPNACWELDFGRPVRAETLILTTRADFPHDAWWTQARLTLSTGEERILPLSKTAEGQLFDLNGVVITGLKLDQLIKADDPSPLPRPHAGRSLWFQQALSIPLCTLPGPSAGCFLRFWPKTARFHSKEESDKIKYPYFTDGSTCASISVEKHRQRPNTKG